MVNLLEFIRIQWDDIHHSRNQDWKVLAIIGGAFYVLLQTTNPAFQIAATIFGSFLIQQCLLRVVGMAFI